MYYLKKLLDGLLYGFIGPFSMLFIIPQFLLKIDNRPNIDGFGLPLIEGIGKCFMWFGAALAIWCSVVMFIAGKGTPLVVTPPKKILTKGIFGIIRHPMMWAITFVLIGESVAFGSYILIIWLIAWIRIGHLIVVNYEEPQLLDRFGNDYKEYCNKVPRWIPNIFKIKNISKT